MRGLESRQYGLEIIAGQCSVSREHLDELYEMSEIQVSDGRGGMRALSAVRFVGLKSRTELNLTGKGMGMDYSVVMQALEKGFVEEVPPSVSLAEKFVKETGMGIAAEIMVPGIQLPCYEGRIPKGQFLPWNPSNDQLGWSVSQMAAIAGRNNWTVGLKHGKWLGKPYEDVTRPDSEIITSMESTWHGLATYARAFLKDDNIVFIHRGVDVSEKGEYRNALIHEAVRRLARKFPHMRRYLDPSHSFGPKLRDQIVKETVEAMRMMVGNEYLYSGILIEAGTSETDTEQHITVDELGILVKEISKFRNLRGPFLPTE